MNEKEQLRLVFNELGEHWGLSNFNYKDQNSNALVFNDDLMVHFKQSDNLKKLIVFASLGPAYSPNDSMESRFRKLHDILHANLLWKDTADGTLGLRNSGELVFSYQMPIKTLTAQGFEALLDAFVNQVAKLKDQLLNTDDVSEDLTLKPSTENNITMLKV